MNMHSPTRSNKKPSCPTCLPSPPPPPPPPLQLLRLLQRRVMLHRLLFQHPLRTQMAKSVGHRSLSFFHSCSFKPLQPALTPPTRSMVSAYLPLPAPPLLLLLPQQQEMRPLYVLHRVHVCKFPSSTPISTRRRHHSSTHSSPHAPPHRLRLHRLCMRQVYVGLSQHLHGG